MWFCPFLVSLQSGTRYQLMAYPLSNNSKINDSTNKSRVTMLYIYIISLIDNDDNGGTIVSPYCFFFF